MSPPDYRRGLVSGITFCLFALPMLTSQESDEVDAGRANGDVPEGDQVETSFCSGTIFFLQNKNDSAFLTEMENNPTLVL
jgi:hypothetical protein